jgi:hypothetical protein
MRRAIVLTHNGVDLVSSWASIMQVIEARCDPSHQELAHKHQQNGKNHPGANPYQEQTLLP